MVGQNALRIEIPITSIKEGYLKPSCQGVLIRCFHTVSITLELDFGTFNCCYNKPRVCFDIPIYKELEAEQQKEQSGFTVGEGQPWNPEVHNPYIFTPNYMRDNYEDPNKNERLS